MSVPQRPDDEPASKHDGWMAMHIKDGIVAVSTVTSDGTTLHRLYDIEGNHLEDRSGRRDPHEPPWDVDGRAGGIPPSDLHLSEIFPGSTFAEEHVRGYLLESKNDRTVVTSDGRILGEDGVIDRVRMSCVSVIGHTSEYLFLDTRPVTRIDASGCVRSMPLAICYCHILERFGESTLYEHRGSILVNVDGVNHPIPVDEDHGMPSFADDRTLFALWGGSLTRISVAPDGLRMRDLGDGRDPVRHR